MGYPAFPGLSSGQAVCDLVNRVFNPYSVYGGICGTEYFLVAYYAQTCPAGYYFHYSTAYPIQETCYKNSAPNQCPGVAAGERPFTLDPSGLTCSRPDTEKLTITLAPEIATIEPWHKKHDKEHLKANLPYKAIVKDQNGQPKAGFAVTITTEVTSDSGGHVHTNNRPKGKLVAGTAASTKDGKIEVKGKTNGIGIFEFTFGTEEASGTHTLTAKCDSGCQAPATATVKAEIKGLMLLNADPLGYELRGETDTHPGSHYYSPEAIVNIINLAHEYKKKFGKVLKINDSSLVSGGLFDITGNWTPSHKTHRKGIVVDINNYRTEPDPDFERLAKRFGINPIWEGLDVTPTPHYHLLLIGERG